MRVDWVALGIATVVSIVTSVIFTILLATGIRLVSAAKIKSNEGGSGTATVTLWYIRIGVAGLLVLSGIYLIVPQLHEAGVEVPQHPEQRHGRVTFPMIISCRDAASANGKKRRHD